MSKDFRKRVKWFTMLRNGENLDSIAPMSDKVPAYKARRMVYRIYQESIQKMTRLESSNQ